MCDVSTPLNVHVNVISFLMYVHIIVRWIFSRRYTIKRLHNDIRLVNDVIISAVHVHTLSTLARSN